MAQVTNMSFSINFTGTPTITTGLDAVITYIGLHEVLSLGSQNHNYTSGVVTVTVDFADYDEMALLSAAWTDLRGEVNSNLNGYGVESHDYDFYFGDESGGED